MGLCPTSFTSLTTVTVCGGGRVTVCECAGLTAWHVTAGERE